MGSMKTMIGEAEPGAGVVFEGGGVRGALAFGTEVDALGADGAEVEIDGGGAGAAVEGEGDGPIGLVDDVAGVDHLGDGFVFRILDWQGSDRGGVLDGLAVLLDGLGDVSVGGEWVGHGCGRRAGGRCSSSLWTLGHRGLHPDPGRRRKAKETIRREPPGEA